MVFAFWLLCQGIWRTIQRAGYAAVIEWINELAISPGISDEIFDLPAGHLAPVDRAKDNVRRTIRNSYRDNSWANLLADRFSERLCLQVAAMRH